MTWMELKILLDNMVEIKHSAMGESVECLVAGSRYDVQLFENLVDGTLVLVPSFGSAEENSDD